MSELYDKISDLRDQKLKLELGDTPILEGKFLKIEDDLDGTIYMYCFENFPSGNDMVIRGLGFTWEVTPYWDATSMISSWGYDIMKKKYDYLKFVKDTISFTPITETKDVKSFEFTIKDSNNQVVYTAPSSTKLPVKFVWDGKNNEKLPAPDPPTAAYES